MARAFSEREREIIRQKLIEQGREAFSVLGIKKTSVDGLVRAVGISKGSFYAFFNSKEEMYLEIIEIEESKYREQIMAESIHDRPITKQTIKSFILSAVHIMETNPLIRRVYEQDELNQVLRAVPQERFAQHIQKDEEWLGQLIAGWQEQGLVIEADSQVIAGVIKLVVASSLLRDSIGGGHYPETIELLADLVASGLGIKE